jgi:hypothetical protein
MGVRGVDFFDDDATGQASATDTPSPDRPSRRRSNRRRTRIQRIVILAAILFLVVFGLAWWARSCQQNRKVGSYRAYLDGVSSAISDSAALGKQLDRLVANPTRFSRKQLIGKLDELSGKQAEIAVRSDRLKPPDTLKAEQSVFASGMRVRADGFKLLRTALMANLGSKTVKAAQLSALAAYFAGPDAYYMDLFYTPTRKVMSDDGVTDVVVPTSTFYLTAKTFDRARLETMLNNVGSSSKLSGIHGVALVSVIATTETGKVPLSAGKTVNLPASAQLSFAVKVQNQGDVAEKNVPVVATLTLPGGGSPLVQDSTIASIAPGQAQSVTIQGFAIPSEALSKICTLKVKAGPVPEERVLSNNSGTYKFLLQLK